MIDTAPRGREYVARFGQRHPVVVDVFVALAWMLLTLPSLALVGVGVGVGTTIQPGLLVLLAVAVATVAIILAALRRRRPVLAFALIFVVTLPLWLVDPSLGNLGAAFAVFAIAVYDSVRRAWLAVAVSGGYIVIVAGVYAVFGIPTWFAASDERVATTVTYVVTASLTLLVAVLWGQNAAARKRYIEDLIEHARHLERERDQQVRLAALAERSRIARDVHDIVAHSLSVIVRLADGARAVFDQQPDRARDAVGQVGEVARSSLTEMRRVIGVLETSPASLSGSGFDDLGRLVEVYRGVGLPVELTVRGPAPSQAGVQMTVFRVVQEALTNALRHSPAPQRASVVIETDADVTAVISNDGVTSAGASDDHVGRGIVGMRERAALYGGQLEAGPDGAGGWTVRLVLPGAGS